MSLYRDYDDLLGQSMVRETHLFFEEMLKCDRSLLEFVHCDWSILNERLAQHYGIAGVKGHSFRKVDLPADSHRGGVLTQASVLKVTANGLATSPVQRGAFVLDRILGTPPRRPPTTWRRSSRTYAVQPPSGHNSPSTGRMRPAPPATPKSTRRVLPWRVSTSSAVGAIAIAFTPVIIRSAWDKASGKPKMEPWWIAPTSWTVRASSATWMSSRNSCLQDKDQIARSLTEKLLVFATGHKMEFADRDTVEKIVAALPSKNYGFRALIHEVVQSEMFRNK